MDGSRVVSKNRHCNLCNAFFNSPVAVLYCYLGKHHTRTLKQLSGDQAHAPAQSMQPVSALGVGHYLCSMCDIVLTSVESYQSHAQGDEHQINKKKLKKRRLKQNPQVVVQLDLHCAALSALQCASHSYGTCDSHLLVKLRAAEGTNGFLMTIEDLILNYIVLP
ncbi:hypothetical protein AV530_017148 [Patagioenas fasciata monilis]|uniref:C2H2-type domain-containing protein n=1 Tax=Patagioenas fasciata monilis TaxID=372326 RepID=A0A1V4JEU9_PATFA|nr:hypothetical protein AV530_017148 [Patagioenas fasciata monilis]